ncbi:MAG: hypothetical protein IPL32_16570 [Chloracidobacterium sp.]|nr:hypothetical protein [Chloracidobacterium sp.]
MNVIELFLKKALVFSVVALFCLSLTGVSAQVPISSPQTTPEPVLGSDFKRWIEVDIFNFVTRYRYARADNNETLNDQAQWQVAFKTRFKFDRAGRYSVNAGVFTGSNFISNWNNLGPGTGKLQSNVYVKQLYFDAKLTKKIEVQIGGITINSGENSEATTYDNDGFITGARIVIRAPKSLYFDEISATNAYLGDLIRPSIFGRLHRLNESNYRQILVRKQATKRIGFSADYTFVLGTDTLREAVRIKPKHFFLNTLLFDAYQRVSTPKGYGFDIFGEKVINKHLMVNGGFARIDRWFTLNGDRFLPGKRLYTSLVFKLRNDLTLSPVLFHAVGALRTPLSQRTRFDFILTWNVLETLHRHHVL